MARALESDGNTWLREWGIQVPAVVRVSGDLEPNCFAGLGPAPWVVKPDVPMGGKGLKGFVRVCDTESQVATVIDELRGDEFFGDRSVPVLIEEFVEGPEFYASIAIDEHARKPVMRFAAEGGVGFDATKDAAAVELSFATGLLASDVNQLFQGLDLDAATAKNLSLALHRMWRAFCASEATLLEINPFRIRDHDPFAVGIALEFDDNGTEPSAALRPHNLLGREEYRVSQVTDRERSVLKANRELGDSPNVSFIELDGDVSLLISGGGGALLCMDRLHDIGLDVACYIDSSPGADKGKLLALLGAGMAVPDIKAILFGAVVVSLDDVSRMTEVFIEAFTASGLDPEVISVIVRIAGPNEAAAHDMLREHIPAARVFGREATLEDACDAVLEAIKA